MQKICAVAALVLSFIFVNAQCPQFLNIDTSFCSGSVNLTVDASVLSTQLCGDSVTIVFNATGTTLAGDTNVYMHSGPEFTPFTGWQGNYTAGTWGSNNGVGRMKSLGNNEWTITVNPRTYYNYPTDSCLNGIFMVFRNVDGSVSVNYNSTDIFLYTLTGTLSSSCPYITGTETHSTNVTYHWSDNNTSASRTFTTGGNYTVTATGVGGCTATGTVDIAAGTHAPVNLGNDIVKCSHSGTTTLNAGSGFASYTWLNGTTGTTSTYVANNPGPYWVKAVDNGGCSSYDTVTLRYSDVLGLSLPDTITSCPGNLVSLDASNSIEMNGDLISIIYDGTTGQSGLTNAAKVYMHAGPEFYAGQGWEGAYTVGNWGQDDGVGKMDSLGNNHWEITINPHVYFHVNPDTPITGIYMVFRNADGSETGKDSNGGNIYIALNGTTVTSQFFGVYAFRRSTGNITYDWNNVDPVSSIAVDTSGLYIVTVKDDSNCTKSDSVRVLFNNNITTTLPAQVALCGSASAVLTPGAGFTSYNWSNGDTTAVISVTATGVYTVTVTSTSCSATATTTVAAQGQGQNVSITNGAQVIRCSASQQVTLTAANGLAQYLWFGVAPSSKTKNAVNEGTYWVEGIDSSGCASYDTVVVTNSSTIGLSLPDSLFGCTGDTLHTDALVSINAKGDSITIVYDDSKGVSSLVGSPKVYMHSGPEFYNGSGWNGAYTVGNWGQDDGIGEMTSLGNNKWSITILPYNYYHINPDTPLYGLFMVFRNADGTQTGKDDTSGNIFLQIAGVNPPASPFTGVSTTRKAALPLSFAWSNGVTSSIGAFTHSGTYTVTVSDVNCSALGITTVTDGQGISLSLGPDTTVCPGSMITVNAPAGFNSYVWSTGASTAQIYISTTGTYYLTVTTAGGCSGSDSIVVDSCNHTITPVTGCGSPTASFVVQSITPANTVTLKNTSLISKTLSYLWNFGDGTTSTDTGSIVHTYAATGVYVVTLTVEDSCGGIDSAKVSVSVNYTGINAVAGLESWNVYPNPTSGSFNIELSLTQAQKLSVRIFNQLGQTVWMKNEEFAAGSNLSKINGENLAAGIYSVEITGSSESVVKKLIISK